MKRAKALILIFVLIVCGSEGYAQILLQHSNWMKDTKTSPQNVSLSFEKDTLLIKRAAGNKLLETIAFMQRHDTLLVANLNNKKNEALYKVSFSNNADVLSLRNIKTGQIGKSLAGAYSYIPDRGSVARNWPHLDAYADSVAGISLDKAYDLLRGRKSKTIIVAVIDNGFDIDHEDLKDVIWTNTKEIPGNGIDDDHNGYVDDVHGWNFRSDKAGNMIPDEQSSATQMYVAFKDKYNNADTTQLNSIEKKQWAVYQRAKSQYLETIKTSKDSGDIKFAYNINYNSGKLIGDGEPGNRFYGSPVIKGTAALSHGTHVAGIIAAKRDNGKGVDGIADNVLIMPIIATTGYGDERDKDIANAIHYAVDNGARIINMSFSKKFSPDKQLVDQAIRYAEKKHVLIIHAAGNEGNNIDTANYYPIPYYNDGTKASTVITVGWNRPLFNYRLAHPYSNYGKNNVDIFAPGSDILSTVPGNGYDYKSGSSMSTPVVTGVAALLMSYFPNLPVNEIKDILLKSSFKPNITVNRPDSKIPVPFNSLSVSGGIVNAYNAVKMAMEMSGEK
jgi:subtilisin family serine protease